MTIVQLFFFLYYSLTYVFVLLFYVMLYSEVLFVGNFHILNRKLVSLMTSIIFYVNFY